MIFFLKINIVVYIYISNWIITVDKTNFQYGVSADVYSLAVIIFELFSGINPFPGSPGQIFEAKRLDEKPVIPSDFPSDLKEVVNQGWSKDPKERLPIHKFQSALNKMLPSLEKSPLVTLPEDNSLNEKERQPIVQQEVISEEKTGGKLYTNTKPF
jgi:serine/threonine protein kinase